MDLKKKIIELKSLLETLFFRNEGEDKDSSLQKNPKTKPEEVHHYLPHLRGNATELFR